MGWDWRQTDEQGKVLEPLEKIKEKYGRAVAKFILSLPPKHQRMALYEAHSVGYQIVIKVMDLEFKRAKKVTK